MLDWASVFFFFSYKMGQPDLLKVIVQIPNNSEFQIGSWELKLTTFQLQVRNIRWRPRLLLAVLVLLLALLAKTSKVIVRAWTWCTNMCTGRSCAIDSVWLIWTNKTQDKTSLGFLGFFWCSIYIILLPSPYGMHIGSKFLVSFYINCDNNKLSNVQCGFLSICMF